MKIDKILLLLPLIICLSFSVDLYPTYLNYDYSSGTITCKWQYDNYNNHPINFSVNLLVNGSVVYTQRAGINDDIANCTTNGRPSKMCIYPYNQTIKFMWTPIDNGIYNITCFVDSGNNVSESNENNNKISKTFILSPEPESYRISINNPNSNILTNFQVKIELNPNTINWNKVYTDGSNIRFLDQTLKNKISYWIEDFNYSAKRATIWIKVPKLKPGNSFIYLILTSNKTSESNGSEVFEFFDNFNGNSLDTSKWKLIKILNGVHSSVYENITNGTAEYIAYSNYYHTNDKGKSYVELKTKSAYSGIFQTKINFSWYGHGGKSGIKTDSNDIITYSNGRWESYNTGFITINHKINNENVSIYGDADSTLETTPYSTHAGFKIDYFFIRKYSANEPTVKNITYVGNSYLQFGNTCICHYTSGCNKAIASKSCLLIKPNTNIKGLLIFDLVSNKIFDCQGYVLKGTNGNTGVDISSSNNINIINCNFKNFNIGINIGRSNNILLINNILLNNNIGIKSYRTINLTINNNKLINNNNKGIKLNYLKYSKIINNDIYNSSTAISIINSNKNKLSKNNIYNSKYAIYFEGSFIFETTNNTISSNKIQNVKYAIASDGEIIQNNNIYNNILNVTVNYTKNITLLNYWNTSLSRGTNIIGGYVIGGNYWTNSNGTGPSDTCFDLDKNGICDFSYKINSNNTDYLPLAGPNAKTVTPCGKCICVNITRVNRTIEYSVTNYCRPINHTVKVLLYNDYVPWRLPMKKDTVTIHFGDTLKFNKTIPDAFVGWTDFEVIVKDAITNKTLSESGDFKTDVPPKIKVDQSQLLILLTIVLVGLFMIKENKTKQP